MGTSDVGQLRIPPLKGGFETLGGTENIQGDQQTGGDPGIVLEIPACPIR